MASNNYFFVEIFKSLPNFSSLANSVYHELNYQTKYGNTDVRVQATKACRHVITMF